MRYFRLTSATGLLRRRNRLSSCALGASSLLVSASFVSLCVAAPTTPPLPNTKKAAPLKNASSDYILGADDILEIKVSNHAELNTTVTVRPDGRITLDRAGEVTAAGKTALTLANEIERKLARTLNNARVQVAVKQARVRQSRILGAVKNPGAYPLKKDARLVDLVAEAGGLSTKASRITGRLIRSGNVIPLQVMAALNQPRSSANIAIQPDDIVEFNAPDFTKQITVSGRRSTGRHLRPRRGLDHCRIVGTSWWSTADAALKQAYVLRNGKPIPLDLSGTNEGRSAITFQFRAGDVLVVPQNQARFGIIGQVAHPNYYPLPEVAEEATVLKALAQAGGAVDDGDLSNITLTRVTNGTTVRLPIDAVAMLAGTSPTMLCSRQMTCFSYLESANLKCKSSVPLDVPAVIP